VGEGARQQTVERRKFLQRAAVVGWTTPVLLTMLGGTALADTCPNRAPGAQVCPPGTCSNPAQTCKPQGGGSGATSCKCQN
jgi:hypothetical protein